MPIIVAIAIRYLIMAAVQLGLWSLLEKYGIPLLNSAIESLMQTFGVSRDTAQAIMGNKVIRAFEEVGIFAVSLKTKLPIKVAEVLGFTSKGYGLRTIKEVNGLIAEKTAISATTKAVATSAEIEKVAEVVAKTTGWKIKGVGDLLKYVTLFVGTPVGVFYALAQYIDYAAWQNPYQKTFEGLLAYIGIKVSDPLPTARTISQDTWKRIYNTIEQLKPVGMSFPFSGVDSQYSRENLAKLVDEIAANLTKNGTQATYKNVIALVLTQLQFNGKEPAVPMFPIETAQAPVATASVATTKVFTGVVSKGVVGGGLDFVARPDDLIESLGELQSAINNNVAPYLASLLNKVVYEIKVVSSVIVGGLKQTGTAQQIQSGTNANGTPKFKTVINKFAVADLFLITERGTRTKLTSIVLGPTDALKFQPTGHDLVAVSGAVGKNILTSNTDEIDKIVTGTPTLVVPPATTFEPDGEPSIGYTFVYDGYLGSVSFNTKTVNRLRREVAGGAKSLDDAVQELLTITEGGDSVNPNQNPNVVRFGFTLSPQKYRDLLSTGGTFAGTPKLVASAEASPPAPASSQGSLPPASVVPASALPATALTAQTLFEFYQALGQALPPLSVRADLYQALGLGQSAFYTGTAEQNTKLLQSLKLKGV